MSKDSKATKQKAKILSFVPTAEYYFSKGIKAYNRRDFHKAKNTSFVRSSWNQVNR